MNPCPAGGADIRRGPAPARPTRWRYAGRVSGPLLDRIDLHLRLPPVAPEDLDGPPGRPRRRCASGSWPAVGGNWNVRTSPTRPWPARSWTVIARWTRAGGSCCGKPCAACGSAGPRAAPDAAGGAHDRRPGGRGSWAPGMSRRRCSTGRRRGEGGFGEIQGHMASGFGSPLLGDPLSDSTKPGNRHIIKGFPGSGVRVSCLWASRMGKSAANMLRAWRGTFRIRPRAGAVIAGSDTRAVPQKWQQVRQVLSRRPGQQARICLASDSIPCGQAGLAYLAHGAVRHLASCKSTISV